MNYIKRVGLFLLTNIAIIFFGGLVIFILENYLGIKVSASLHTGFGPLLAFSLIYGFTGSFISLLISKWLAKRMYSIDVIEESMIMNYPNKIQFAYFKTKEFASRSNIKMPEFGVYESSDPNAFATGPSKNNSLVAISTGLIEFMNESEIEGVIAHEMSHITNGDMVTMTLVQGVINAFVIFLARVIGFFVDAALSKGNEKTSGIGYHLTVFLMEIVLSILASIIVMAYSRKREYSADFDSTKLTSKQNMINALKKLQTLSSKTNEFSDNNLAAFKISGKKGFLSLFSSHPDLADRIKKLENNYSI